MTTILKKTSLFRFFLGILLLFINLTACPIVQAQGDRASEVIQLVNALRAARGLPVYQVDYSLTYAAQAQASWSAENNHIGHDNPGGSSPDDRAIFIFFRVVKNLSPNLSFGRRHHSRTFLY